MLYSAYVVGLAAAFAATAAGQPRRNVLLVISDDLRPELPCYGCGHVVAPHTTRLAKDAVRFTRAYVQQSLCAPSRNSFLSGRRPEATQSWQFLDSFREVGPDWTTLPGAFKKAGYQAVGCGKIFHPGLPPHWDMPLSWDGRMNTTWADWMYPSEPECPNNNTWCVLPDHAVFQDTQTTATALELLDNVTQGERPFFLAAGYRKPHLQWRVPERIAKLYPGGPNATGLAKRRVAPVDSVDLAFHMPIDELSAFADVAACGGPYAIAPHANYPEACQRSFRYGYFLGVSFMDEQLGVLLDALEARELDASTAVVFAGDHGWHLGDQAEWLKFTNYENGVRIPLLVKVPWLMTRGVVTAPVELVDLYPTLAGALGVDVSYTKSESAPLAGRDLTAALRDPARADPAHVARSVFPRCVGGIEYNDGYRNTSYPDWYLTDCNDVARENFTHMGYSTRDERWRFTAWYNWSRALAPAGLVALELYDHLGDDGDCPHAFDFETANVARDPAHGATVAFLLARLEGLFNISQAG